MTESEIREVLALAIGCCPEDVTEVMRLHTAAVDAVSSLPSAQLSGPHAAPESVDRAFETFTQALDDLAGTVAWHARQGSEVTV